MFQDSTRNNIHQEIPEQVLWRAVIISTVQEWLNGPLRRKREAEIFLFQDEKDYRAVCFSAGIDPVDLRERLQKMKARGISTLNLDPSRN